MYEASNALGLAVRILESSTYVPGAISIYDGSGKLLSDSDLIVISSISIDARTNAQFIQSLGDRIYAYTFGDQMGTAVIGGLAFNLSCTNSNGSGLNAVIQFFNKYKVSNANSSTGIPVIKIQIGSSITISGYLIGVQVNINDPATRISQFSMMLKTLPGAMNG